MPVLKSKRQKWQIRAAGCTSSAQSGQRFISFRPCGTGGESSPVIVRALILRLGNGADLNQDLRSRAVRVVAASGSEEAVHWLTRIVLTQHLLFRYTKLRKASPETVAGVAGLAAHWRTHPHAALALLLARRSRDAAYRHAVRRGEEK